MSLQILILALVGIILVVLLIRLYPVIYTGVSRLIFGKYSARYFATYKRQTGQNPYPYCIKDDFINYIAGFYQQRPTVANYESSSEINFLDHEFGVGFRQVLRQQKKPFCINATRLKEFEIKILGYKDALFTVEMKKYFFFVNGTFFLGQLSFKNPEKESIEKIIGVIRKKYLTNQVIDSDRFLINGKNNTRLFCHYNGFHLTVSYLSRDREDVNNKIDTYWRHATNIEIKKQSSLEDELMEKL